MDMSDRTGTAASNHVSRAGTSATATDCPDDMHDTEIPGSQPLHNALLCVQATLTPAFDCADTAALRYQRRHRFLLTFAAICGTLAISLAILQLSELFNSVWLLPVEAFAAFFAAVAVSFGLIAALQRNWLLERHKAERLRMLKFRFLIDPSLWSGNATEIEACRDRLAGEVAEIERMTSEQLEEWIGDDVIVDAPSNWPTGSVMEAHRALIAYFQRKRFDVQLRYFQERVRGNTRLDVWTRRALPVFFFLSIVAALGHFIIDLVARDTDNMAEAAARSLSTSTIDGTTTLSVWLIVLAAGLPVVAAGVRTIRMAQEPARNRKRYLAKKQGLDHLVQSLPKRTESLRVFHDLWYAEQIFEAEHREWLRLMMEAEWW
jgi:hypothetical protein